MKWWHRLQWKRKRKKALRNIREGFGFWGIFMVGMTDDELEKRILDTAPMFGGVCYTAEDALNAIHKMMI